jgi:anti-sigma factor RsiW
MTNSHLSVETIGDFHDGALALGARRLAEEHLERCAECRDALARVRALRADAVALPRELEPPAEIWSAVHAEVQRRSRAARSPAAAVAAWRSLAHSDRAWLAAAALVLAVGSAGVTAVALKGPSAASTSVAADRRAEPRTESQVMLLPASVQMLERDLGVSVARLERALDERRGSLLPSTRATVEHSLSVIDDAIAEARAALASDPANPALVDALSRGYESKIDLLKRANELAPRT